MGRKIFLTRSATSLTFSNRSGSFTMPVTETTGDAETTHARHDQQRRRMTFAEWSAAVDGGRQKDAAAPARRVVLPVLLPRPDPTPEKTADAFTALTMLEDAAEYIWHTSLFYPKRYPSAETDPDSHAALVIMRRAENDIWIESKITR